MVIIGKPGGVSKPYAVLRKLGVGDEIPITMVSVEYTIGAIPRCRVGIPPEFLQDIPMKATDDVYEVVASEVGQEQMPIFTGYVAGPSGRKTGRSYTAGIDLIHIARDLDQMRLSAPSLSLNEGGINDFRYQRAGSNVTTENTSQFNILDDSYYSSIGGAPLAQQIIDGVIKKLEKLFTVVKDGKVPIRKENYNKAIQLLESIDVVHGVLSGPIGKALASKDQNSINSYLVQRLNNSFESQSSIWDTMSAIFADFGLTFLCKNDGTVAVVANLANFTPPDSNFIDGGFIVGMEFGAKFYRNVREISLIMPNMSPGPYSSENSAENKDRPSTVVTWPAEDDGSNGASLTMLFPGWLTPISFRTGVNDKYLEPKSGVNVGSGQKTDVPVATESLKAIRMAQLNYAEMMFNLEQSKLRTMAVSGPLSPLALPGTTTFVQPYSSVQSRNGRSLGDQTAVFSGYIYSVLHNIDIDGKVFSTTLNLSHVSDVSEELNIDKHPIYSDITKALPLE